MDLNLHIKIDVDELAEVVISDNRNDAINLIKKIDALAQDWDFTLELYEHFSKLKTEFEKESKHDNHHY